MTRKSFIQSLLAIPAIVSIFGFKKEEPWPIYLSTEKDKHLRFAYKVGDLTYWTNQSNEIVVYRFDENYNMIRVS